MDRGDFLDISYPDILGNTERARFQIRSLSQDKVNENISHVDLLPVGKYSPNPMYDTYEPEENGLIRGYINNTYSSNPQLQLGPKFQLPFTLRKFMPKNPDLLPMLPLSPQVFLQPDDYLSIVWNDGNVINRKFVGRIIDFNPQTATYTVEGVMYYEGQPSPTDSHFRKLSQIGFSVNRDGKIIPYNMASGTPQPYSNVQRIGYAKH
jgi:hypothetical protein